MEAFLFVITIAVACLLQGILGFGSALVATPLALIFLDKETVVSSMVVIGIALNGFLAPRIREPMSFRPVLLLFLASLVGMPIGGMGSDGHTHGRDEGPGGEPGGAFQRLASVWQAESASEQCCHRRCWVSQRHPQH